MTTERDYDPEFTSGNRNYRIDPATLYGGGPLRCESVVQITCPPLTLMQRVRIAAYWLAVIALLAVFLVSFAYLLRGAS